MKRMHIHVAVENLSDSIRFYSAMFGNTEPTIRKSDYCKWELSDPAVNFAISQRGAKPGVDHIGIQVETAGTGPDGHDLLLCAVGQGMDD
jgi:hypothetical protein